MASVRADIDDPVKDVNVVLDGKDYKVEIDTTTYSWTPDYKLIHIPTNTTVGSWRIRRPGTGLISPGAKMKMTRSPRKGGGIHRNNPYAMLWSILHFASRADYYNRPL